MTTNVLAITGVVLVCTVAAVGVVVICRVVFTLLYGAIKEAFDHDHT